MKERGILRRWWWLAALAVAFAAPCQAQHRWIEGGMPCVDEVCVADDLVDVLNLPWEAGAPASTPVPPDGVPFIGDVETLRTVGEYWASRVFDSVGLHALAEVDAVCEDLGVWQRPRARFTSDDGWRTTVSFEPVLSEDGHSPRFRVATITQLPPETATRAEVEAFGEEAAEHYAGLPRFPSATAPGVRWRSTSPQGPSLKLFAPIGDATERGIALRQHPLCAEP